MNIAKTQTAKNILNTISHATTLPGEFTSVSLSLTDVRGSGVQPTG